MIALATACAPAHAQDFKRVAPQQPPPSPPAKVVPPAEKAPGSNENRVILHRLAGLRLVGDIGDFKRAGVTERGISILHVPLLASFMPEITADSTSGKLLRPSSVSRRVSSSISANIARSSAFRAACSATASDKFVTLTPPRLIASIMRVRIYNAITFFMRSCTKVDRPAT
ncbi:MAG: hypothetical protein KGJ66_02120 [Alphaproteobacteria bacterium]|nr:hypothetical protein [Alphaproteobacteria bacterium]